MPNKNKISVHHEWGKLKEVIIGRGEDLTIPKWLEGMDLPDKHFVTVFKKYGGKKLSDFNPESSKKVIEQINGLADLLEKKDIIVHRNHDLAPDEKEFQAIGLSYLFPRDLILVINNNIIELCQKNLFRRKEIFSIRPAIIPHLKDSDVKYISMPKGRPKTVQQGFFLEGGDVLLNGYEIYVGDSNIASNKAGIDWLQNYLGPKYKVHRVRLKHDVLHLDCALSLLRPGLGVMCPDAFIDELPSSIKDWDFVTITNKEMHKLAANIFVLDDKTAIIEKQHHHIGEKLNKKGHNIIEIPYDEVSKYGGAFRCSHHPLRRESNLA